MDSLVVREVGGGEVAEALANLQFASRSLTLDNQPMQKLLVLSSTIIVELVLIGMCALRVDRKIILTALQITFRINRRPPAPSIYYHFPFSLQ